MSKMRNFFDEFEHLLHQYFGSDWSYNFTVEDSYTSMSLNFPFFAEKDNMKHKYIRDDGDIDIEKYLEDNDYDSIEDWALDSGYAFNKDGWYWYDEDGFAVDLSTKIWFAVDAIIQGDLYGKQAS